MPRQSAKRKNVQAQHGDQDSFDFSTPNMSVVARPTDQYVRPQLSNNAAAVAQFAQTGGHILDGFVKRKQMQHEEDIQAGKRARIKGEEMPEDSSTGFVKGYEMLDGQAGGAELTGMLKKHYEENWQMTPEEFQASQDEIISGFLNGRSDNYIDGILPGALAADQKYTQAHFEAQRTIVEDNVRTNVRKITDGMVDTMLEEDNLNPTAMRSALSDLQKQAGIQGLNRTDVAHQFIETAGRRAVMEGRPELLKVAFERDKSGIRLIDNPELANRIVTLMKQADAAVDEQEQAYVQAQKERQKELIGTVERTLAEKIMTLSPDSPEWSTVKELLYNASDPERNDYGVALDADEIEHYYKLVNELRTGGTFAQESDMVTYMDLYSKARADKLDTKDLLESMSKLDRSSVKEIIKARATAKGSGSAGNAEFMNRYNGLWNETRKLVNKQSALHGPLDANGPKRARLIDYFKWTMLDEFTEHHDRNPSMEEILKMAESAEAAAYKSYPEDNLSALLPKGQGGQGQNGQAGQPDDVRARRKNRLKNLVTRMKPTEVKDAK